MAVQILAASYMVVYISKHANTFKHKTLKKSKKGEFTDNLYVAFDLHQKQFIGGTNFFYTKVKKSKTKNILLKYFVRWYGHVCKGRIKGG